MRKGIGFILCFFCYSIYAQNFDKVKMDSLFSLIEVNNRGMGSISIFKDQEEVYSYSMGYIDVQDQLKADRASLYRIGSISKMFTASLCMKMVEEGKLSLEDKLSKYFPKIPEAKNITIEHLLRHQSGIFNITAAIDYQDWLNKKFSRKEMIEKIASYDRVFEAGKSQGYSNSNYILLTFILEDITEATFDELVQEYICKVCGMERTKYGSTINSGNNEAFSYEFAGEELKPSTETDPSIPLGAGGIISTSTELNQFLNCLYENKLLKAESLDSMMTIKGSFGIGMFTIPFYDKKAYGHTGGIDAFQANAFYFPEDQVAISYTSNAVRTPVNDILIGALSIYFGREYELPEFQNIIQLTEEELKVYHGVYSSPSFPLKLTVSSEGNVLYGQGSGQPKFPLEAIGEHEFQYLKAKLKITFNPSENKLNFTQMGQSFELTKE